MSQQIYESVRDTLTDASSGVPNNTVTSVLLEVGNENGILLPPKGLQSVRNLISAVGDGLARMDPQRASEILDRVLARLRQPPPVRGDPSSFKASLGAYLASKPYRKSPANQLQYLCSAAANGTMEENFLKTELWGLARGLGWNLNRKDSKAALCQQIGRLLLQSGMITAAHPGYDPAFEGR